MRLAAAWLVASLVSFGPPEEGTRFAPPPYEPGWELREDWNDLWRRFQDRKGRPDPHGPLLQPAPELQRPEYELTLAVARQPLYLERDWARGCRGARVFIHSDDVFAFFNQVRLKERVSMGRHGDLAMRFDRIELREIKSSMFRLDFVFPDIGGSGFFLEFRPVARFEKPDLDLEIATGWARPGVARIQARVFSFDTFNNASDVLAQNRDAEQEIRVVQRIPPFGASLEAELFLHRDVRAELFAGAVFPHRQSLYVLDEEILDRERSHSALLGGAWLEWALPRVPVWIGASGTAVATRQLDTKLDGAWIDNILEREFRARAYLLSRLGPGTRGDTTLEASLAYRRTLLPQHESAYGSVRDDRSILAILRGTWLPTRYFGFELGYLLLDRAARGEGPLPPALSETNHRLSTRFALVFNPWVRITFGVGWDLDNSKNVYDQGGMTLSARW